MRRLGLALGWTAGAAVRFWRPLLGLAAFGCVVYGLELVSHPLALCAGGAGGLLVTLRPQRRKA